jgi:hypothetical protein
MRLTRKRNFKRGGMPSASKRKVLPTTVELYGQKLTKKSNSPRSRQRELNERLSQRTTMLDAMRDTGSRFRQRLGTKTSSKRLDKVRKETQKQIMAIDNPTFERLVTEGLDRERKPSPKKPSPKKAITPSPKKPYMAESDNPMLEENDDKDSPASTVFSTPEQNTKEDYDNFFKNKKDLVQQEEHIKTYFQSNSLWEKLPPSTKKEIVENKKFLGKIKALSNEQLGKYFSNILASRKESVAANEDYVVINNKALPLSDLGPTMKAEFTRRGLVRTNGGYPLDTSRAFPLGNPGDAKTKTKTKTKTKPGVGFSDLRSPSQQRTRMKRGTPRGGGRKKSRRQYSKTSQTCLYKYNCTKRKAKKQRCVYTYICPPP